jgi:glycosyltransferase involved in cell wall biosynthesis
MNDILISILITAYNCENFIENAIKSAISQTYKNIEILISDDCSTDSTLKIIKKYAILDKRIHFFTSNKNRSIGY